MSIVNINNLFWLNQEYKLSKNLKNLFTEPKNDFLVALTKPLLSASLNGEVMRSLLKKILVKLLATTMRVAVGVLKLFLPLARFTGATVRAIGRAFFTLLLPLFGALLALKRGLLKFYAPLEQRSRILHLFTRRYVFHVTFIGIALTVVTANLNAYEVKRDEFTYANVFTGLSRDTTYDDLEEVRPPATPVVRRYLSQSAVAPGTRLDAAAADQELSPPTTMGGSAVVKPLRLPTDGTAAEDLAPGAPRNDIMVYTVQEGDTISGVSARFSISINTILWENSLTAYSIIRPGQKLTILPISGVRHKVARGETVGKIATRYGVDADAIISANKLASANDLQVGELLLVPGGAKPRPTPTYALRRPAASTPTITGSGKLGWPATCRRITQYFGWRHTGVDIACPTGTAVYAADDGRIIKAQGGWNGGYGIMIVIQHADGSQTLYGHNSKLYVQVGDEVTRGQAIAAVGSTGRSTGPHVHFEVRAGGYRRNPFSYLK